MTPAGYSGTPLARKLGIKADMTCAAIDAPPEYEALLDGLPDGVRFDTDVLESLDFVHVFVDKADGLGRRLTALRQNITPNGMIWVSWPKKASGVKTDVTGNVVRDAGLGAGLVDIKVCAVDETWSGLKFVIPRAQRPRR